MVHPVSTLFLINVILSATMTDKLPPPPHEWWGPSPIRSLHVSHYNQNKWKVVQITPLVLVSLRPVYSGPTAHSAVKFWPERGIQWNERGCFQRQNSANSNEHISFLGSMFWWCFENEFCERVTKYSLVQLDIACSTRNIKHGCGKCWESAHERGTWSIPLWVQQTEVDENMVLCCLQSIYDNCVLLSVCRMGSVSPSCSLTRRSTLWTKILDSSTRWEGKRWRTSPRWVEEEYFLDSYFRSSSQSVSEAWFYLSSLMSRAGEHLDSGLGGSGCGDCQESCSCW